MRPDLERLDLSERGHAANAVPYYVDLDQGCDALVRCHDCRRLVTHATFVKHHACPRCGTRKVTEVRTLSLWEWVRIRVGLLDFPYRQQFLQEFAIRAR